MKLSEILLKSQPNPFKLIKGVYNPPQSMSKRTAKRWAEIAPMKDSTVQKIDLNKIVTEKSFIMNEADNGKTLMKVVSQYFGLDPPTARLKIIAGEIWIKDSMHSKYADIKPTTQIICGDTLAGAIRKAPSIAKLKVKSQDTVVQLKMSVLYKDQDILVINKTSELAVHAGSKNSNFNLEHFLSTFQTPTDLEAPRLVHRLDKNTTGCLVLARTKASAARMAKYFENSEAIEKRYIAMIVPPLTDRFAVGETFTITSGITKFGENRTEKMKCVPWNDSFKGEAFSDIQKAVTDVTFLKHRKLSSMACLEPKTGRKHQLRAHIASLNAFILGDYKYGIGCTKQFAQNVSRPLDIPLHLHMGRLVIKNWFGEGNDLTVVAPPPNFWRKTMYSSGHTMEMARTILQKGPVIPLVSDKIKHATQRAGLAFKAMSDLMNEDQIVKPL